MSELLPGPLHDGPWVFCKHGICVFRKYEELHTCRGCRDGSVEREKPDIPLGDTGYSCIHGNEVINHESNDDGGYAELHCHECATGGMRMKVVGLFEAEEPMVWVFCRHGASGCCYECLYGLIECEEPVVGPLRLPKVSI